MRIEDVDAPRSTPGQPRRAILATLARCGFAWDGAGRAPVASARRATRRAGAARARGLAYRVRLLAARPAGDAARQQRRARLSRHLPQRHAMRRAPRAVRAHGACASGDADDRVRRPRCRDRNAQDLAREVGDFVVRRADGLFAYQLAVVVDDAPQGMTDRRARRRPARLHAAPDLPAARARLRHAGVPARSGRARRARREAVEADARRAVAATTRCPRLSPRGASSTSRCRRRRRAASRSSGRSPRARGRRRACRRCRCSPHAARRIMQALSAHASGPRFAAEDLPMTTLVVVRKGDDVAIAADSLTTFGDTRLAADTTARTTRSSATGTPTSGCAGRPRTSSCSRACCAQARRPRLLQQARDLRDVPQAASDPQGAALPQPEGGGGRSVRVDADHGADRQRARHLRRVLDARGVRVHAFWAAGTGREFALGAMHALYARLRTAEAVARAGIEAGALFDKNSALPLTLYTLPLGLSAPNRPADALVPFVFEHAAVRGALVTLPTAAAALLDVPSVSAGTRAACSRELAAAAVLLASTLKFSGSLLLQIGGRRARAPAGGGMHGRRSACARPRNGTTSARRALGDAASLADLAGGAQPAACADPRSQGRGHDVPGHRGARGGHGRRAWSSTISPPPSSWRAACCSRSTTGARPGCCCSGCPAASAMTSALGAVTRAFDGACPARLLPTAAARGARARVPGGRRARVRRAARPSRCSCSRERVENALRIAGRDEVESILAEHGGVEVTCEFCNRRYTLDPSEARAVFAPRTTVGRATDDERFPGAGPLRQVAVGRALLQDAHARRAGDRGRPGARRRRARQAGARAARRRRASPCGAQGLVVGGRRRSRSPTAGARRPRRRCSIARPTQASRRANERLRSAARPGRAGALSGAPHQARPAQAGGLPERAVSRARAGARQHSRMLARSSRSSGCR